MYDLFSVIQHHHLLLKKKNPQHHLLHKPAAMVITVSTEQIQVSHLMHIQDSKASIIIRSTGKTNSTSTKTGSIRKVVTAATTNGEAIAAVTVINFFSFGVTLRPSLFSL